MTGKGKSIPRAAERAPTPEPRFLKAFSEIEGDLRDLRRIARLAEEQLHRAIGELAVKDSEYTEVPNYAQTDLAIFAVSQVAKMAEDLETLYDRLYSEPSEARAA
jgi:hypothetical protein